jgi:hypothetical protein
VCNDWSARTNDDAVARRAGGRRHYNSWRQCVALVRRMEVVRLLGRFPLMGWGTVRAIAKTLRVHPSTICRDLQALAREHGRCPCCGQLAVRVSKEADSFADEFLERCRADFDTREWCWAVRGPLPARIASSAE